MNPGIGHGKIRMRRRPRFLEVTARGAVLLMIALGFSACSTNLQTKVSGNLNRLSEGQIVAILPVDTMGKGQKETAELFRQSLYANLNDSPFHLMDRYLVDGALKQHGLTDPGKFYEINPMKLGEMLGADAVVLSRVNKVERSYFVIHSSIELSVSVQMVDTRSGEILWRAEQTESDFEGIAKIPTGIAAAVIAPIQFVTNKLNLNKLTSKMVGKLTAIVKLPDSADQDKKFETTVISSAATRDLKEMEEVQKLQAQMDAPAVLTQEAAADPASGPVTVPLVRGPDTPPFKVRKARLEFDPEERPAVESARAQRIRTVRALPAPGGAAEPNPGAVTPAPRVPARKPVTALKPLLQPDPHPPRESDPRWKNPEPQSFFTIQVGAYRVRSSAERVIRYLDRKGYHAFLTEDTSGGQILFKVRVEKFKNRDQAAELALRLETREKLPNFVTPL